MSEIFKALVKAQKNFEAARKGNKNEHFKSKYADLSACMDAVRDALNDQGIFVTQPVESVESGIVIETMFAHESGETFTAGKLFMPVMKHDAQGYGSALTYARRYSLLTACGVAPEDDDGNAATKNAPAKVAAPVIPATPKTEDLNLTADELNFINDMAEQVRELVASDATAALNLINAAGLEGEQRIALSNMLDSKVRSALKKAKELQPA